MAKDFEEVYQEWSRINNELYNSCKDYLENALSKVDGQCIDFTNEDTEYYVSIPYDGGRHPEYASKCASTVNKVYLKDGKVHLDLEDEDEYSLNRVDATNACDVAYAVRNVTE